MACPNILGKSEACVKDADGNVIAYINFVEQYDPETHAPIGSTPYELGATTPYEVPAGAEISRCCCPGSSSSSDVDPPTCVEIPDTVITDLDDGWLSTPAEMDAALQASMSGAPVGSFHSNEATGASYVMTDDGPCCLSAPALVKKCGYGPQDIQQGQQNTYETIPAVSASQPRTVWWQSGRPLSAIRSWFPVWALRLVTAIRTRSISRL